MMRHDDLAHSSNGSWSPDEEAIDRYLAQEASAEEAGRIAEWLRHRPEQARRLAGLATAAQWEVPAAIALTTERSAERFWTTVRAGDSVRGSTKTVPTSRRASWQVGLVMAACSVVGIAALYRHVATRGATPAVQRYATVAGQQRTVVLEDSSRVILAPSTVLTVENASRQLRASVSGEALFIINHRPSVAFEVRAGRTTTRVLGTTFSVRRYPTERATRVVVTDGRVGVREGEQREQPAGEGAPFFVLDAHMVRFANDSGVVRVIRNVDTKDYTAWTSGKLVFQEARVADIVAELQRAYAANIALSDSTLARNTLTFTVLVTKRSVEDVLEAMAATLDAHVVKSNRGFALVPGVAPAAKKRLSLPSTSHTEAQYGK
jgi:transmembrane sensor